MMLDQEYRTYFQSLQNWMLSEPGLAGWAERLPEHFALGLDEKRFGDLPSWIAALNALEAPTQNSQADLRNDVRIYATEHSSVEVAPVREQFEKLIPWRKGPYDLFGVHLDCEWRSDWKWRRVLPHVDSLENKVVLDVGCGNGYHLWRMLGEGALRAIGIDPSPRFFVQFQMIKKLFGQHYAADLIPIGIESVPENLKYFDSVFSMGILYHRKSPIEHLLQLKRCLKPGGQLILETLVIEGGNNDVLVPADRYAKMPNVWFIPSTQALQGWMGKCGFKDVRCVDLNQTSTDEQRRTEWMQFESLADFLDPEDSNKTIEGYPAPLRAVMVANV